VELFSKDHYTHDGHFELISEPQMASKDYAGIYARHLHMEPVAPECSDFGYSQLWPSFGTLDVIPTTTFGGYGWLHSNVHVAVGGNLFPGYASLGRDGNCYEQKSGYLRVNDVRIDRDANMKISLGDNPGFYSEEYYCDAEDRTYRLGEYADFLDVDSLALYGEMPIDIVIRPEGLRLEPGESRCFPILRYKKIAAASILNHFTLKKNKLTYRDHPSINGSYSLYLTADTACHVLSICIGKEQTPQLTRMVIIPAVPGVTTNPPAGTFYIVSRSDFNFTARFDIEEPLKVGTDRIFDGKQETLKGTLNENGEYEYCIQRITSDVCVTIGPDYAGARMPAGSGAEVWTHNEKLYIRTDRSDVANIYTIAGQLIKRIDLPEGNTATEMKRGVYIVTLKDGSVHKVIIK
jgi:hypothetical protein